MGKEYYRFKIVPLAKEIDAEECKFRIKSNSITIILKKKESGNWTELKDKPSAAAAPVVIIFLFLHN